MKILEMQPIIAINVEENGIIAFFGIFFVSHIVRSISLKAGKELVLFGHLKYFSDKINVKRTEYLAKSSDGTSIHGLIKAGADEAEVPGPSS